MFIKTFSKRCEPIATLDQSELAFRQSRIYFDFQSQCFR
jgi:hypothetical protein